MHKAFLFSRLYRAGNLQALKLRLGGCIDIIVALLLSGVLRCETAFAFPTSFNYDIPAQSLNSALMQFAADSGLALIFTTDIVRGMRSHPLTGQMSHEQALQVLLQNTGLDYQFVDGRTVTLVQRFEAEQPSTPPTKTLESVTVFGDAIKNTDWVIDREITDDAPRSYRASHAITATRTDTPIQHIPQSVQAIKRSIIDDQQNVTVSEALYNVSGVVPRNRLSTPVIEGTLVRGFRAEQLIDGFTQYYNTGDRESLVNIERIEVLKGANALFYSGGSGSQAGGVINIVSKLPNRDAFREIGFRGGSYDFYQPYIDLNQPINDQTAFRLTAEYTESRSQVDVIETERFNVNPSLMLAPDDDTTLIVQGKFSHWQQPEYQGLPATGTLADGFRIRPQTFIGPADISDSRSDQQAIWGTLAHRIDDTWSLEIKARYAGSEFLEHTQTLFNGASFIADTPLLSPSTWALADAELFQQQQDVAFQAYVRAQFDTSITENVLMLGADYSRLRDEGYVDVARRIAGLVDLEAPVFEFPYRIPGPGINNQSVENQTEGGYLQWHSTIAKQIHAVIGARLGGIEIGYHNDIRRIDSKTERVKFLPQAGLAYDLTDTLTVFASYTEGLRGQPFVNFAGTPEPELSSQMEAGIKLDFATRLSGQMTIYQIDRSQVAVATPANPSEFQAIGRQRSRGIEMDWVWQPIENFSVLTNYAHTDARFVDGKAGVPENNRMTAVPEDSGRVWANYRFTVESLRGLGAGMGIYWNSGSYVSNDNQFKTGGYYLFDAAVSYQARAFELAATLKNLTDESYFEPLQYFGGGISGGGRVAYSTGCTFYLSAAIKF